MPSTCSWALEFEGETLWWDEPTINGADIKRLANAPMDYQLYHDIGPDWWDRKPLSDATGIDLRTNKPPQFYVAPPATMYPSGF